MNDLFIVLGNQLFHPKYFKDYKSSFFFLAEDFELCTYEKHHKQKIIFFLSSMRSFKDELDHAGYKTIYHKIEDKEFKDEVTIWVKTRDTKNWINGRKAYFSLNDETPMGYGFGAYEFKKDGFVGFDEMQLKMLRGETMNNPLIRKKKLKV